MDVDDGTRDVSTHDAQRSAADGQVLPNRPASLTHCIVCNDRFTLWKGRRRHHCGRCGKKFCSKHGDTHAHPVLTSCPVPSPCVCNMCLDKQAGRRVRRGGPGTTAGNVRRQSSLRLGLLRSRSR